MERRFQKEEGKSATIMMIDDEPTTTDVIEMFLQGEGYDSFIAINDSRLAVETLAREVPDLVLLDLMMPHVGGLDILKAVGEDPNLHGVPFIILTSSTDSEIKLNALELGASDFLAKPVDRSELALRVRNTLAAKAQRDWLLYHDGLTGLPNRRLFMERLDSALRRSERTQSPLAVMQIGLDRFRQINDTLGQAVGDAFLQAVAERLEKGAADDATDSFPELRRSMPFRLGGDEFTMFLTGPGTAAGIPQLARSLASALAEPFIMEGRELFASCSIGIAMSPGDGDDPESLLASAGAAMSHAKRGGGDSFEFYDESLNARSLERLGLENDLRRALERGEISLHYQPKVDVKTRRIIGAEALMRWEHPEQGMVSPDKFIPIAEEIGLIHSLGEWAFHEACRQRREWRESGAPPLRIAVNVSSLQFSKGALVETIRSALEENGLEGDALTIELTEGIIMENPEETVETLEAIKAMGIKISVDDFGTGYSSLSYLKKFPLDELKIDRSFVMGIPDNSDDEGIVTAIIMMSHSLGLKVVAEGVETEDQLDFLATMGCDQYQGYLCSRPRPASEWTAMFTRQMKRAQQRRKTGAQGESDSEGLGGARLPSPNDDE